MLLSPWKVDENMQILGTSQGKKAYFSQRVMAQACESLRVTLWLLLKHVQGLCRSGSLVILQCCGIQHRFDYPGQDFLNMKGHHIWKQ